MHAHARAEHDAWREVCAALDKSGAVTKEDLRSPKSSRDTEGQLLLAAIRRWGDCLSDLHRISYLTQERG